MTSGCSTRATSGSSNSSRCEGPLLVAARDGGRHRAPAADVARHDVGVAGFAVEGMETLPDGDIVLDFEVTANRPDCTSVRGIAREVADGLRPAAPGHRGPGPLTAGDVGSAFTVEHRAPRPVRPLRGRLRHGVGGAVAAVAAGAAARLRRAAHQQRRGRHQLRAAGAGPADARLRHGQAGRARPSACARPRPARGSGRSTARSARSRPRCW